MSELKVGQRMQRSTDGQVGFLCERPPEDGGGWGVKLDRARQSIIEPYNAHRWAPIAKAKLTAFQIARVCYEADRSLRTVRGEYGIPEWTEMRDELRHKWLGGLPAGAEKDDERVAVYRGIIKALG